jgi:hypothetical protein
MEWGPWYIRKFISVIGNNREEYLFRLQLQVNIILLSKVSEKKIHSGWPIGYWIGFSRDEMLSPLGTCIIA